LDFLHIKRGSSGIQQKKIQKLESGTFNKKQEPIVERMGQDESDAPVKSRNRFMVCLLRSLLYNKNYGQAPYEASCQHFVRMSS
jgi:hypothetical protein